MRARGYLIEVELTDDSLIAEGTNKVGRMALRGDKHDQGPLVIHLADITDVDYKKANALANGNITVKTSDGGKHQLHFRKKSQDEFAALAEALTSRRDAGASRGQ